MSSAVQGDQTASRISVKGLRQLARSTLRSSKRLLFVGGTQDKEDDFIGAKAVKSENPKFKSLKKVKKDMSRSTLSQSHFSQASRTSYEMPTTRNSGGLSADQQVQLALQAKKKALRKNGEVLTGPSMAMMARHKMQTKPPAEKKSQNNQTRLFRKFLPRIGRTASSKKIESGLDTRNSRAELRKQSERTQDDINFIVGALKRLVLFNQHSPSTLETLAACMDSKEYGPDQVVCKQGDFGDEMFVVYRGELEVMGDSAPESERSQAAPIRKSRSSKSTKSSKNGRMSRLSSKGTAADKKKSNMTLKPGSAFGELGMNYGSPRERTVTSLTPVTLFVLNRAMYGRVVENEYRRKNELMFEALRQVKILDKLKPEQLRNMLNYVELVSFPAGEKIIEKGSLGGTFYMIVSGTVECVVYEEENNVPKESASRSASRINGDGSRITNLRGEMATEQSIVIPDDASGIGADFASVKSMRHMKKKSYHCGPGQYFGERALIQNDFVRKADVIATSNVELLAITYESLSEHLAGLINSFEENMRRQALEDTPFFDNLNATETLQLQEALGLKSFKDGDYIIEEGQSNDNFYIIRDGEVDVKKKLDADAANNFNIATLKVENYFGEGSLLFDKPPNASVIAKGSVTCYVLSRAEFKKFVKDETLLMLQRTFNERNRRGIIMKRERTNEVLASVALKDLTMLRTLGSGCFGLVKLVEVPKVDAYFALKILEKGAVVRNNQELNVMNEKKILLESDHPFIVRLYRTFKDKRMLYYLMEFIQGGEMFQFLHHERGGHLDNSTARFFIACVVDALDYLHKRRIVYRDLKPENLMIDSDGYAKVVDFGFAKKLLYKTFTLCGTAQYLAPEILFNKGYGRSVDFWCLGILIYELFTGTTPFKRANRNELFKAIKTENRIKFNRRWKNADEAKELVCLLLHKHSNKRLGCSATGTRGFKEVKQHAWFDEIDFEKLYFKEITPPWLPKIKNAYDATHFEAYDEDDNPLTGKYDDRAGNSEMWADF